MGITFATVALIAAAVMFVMGICLWFMYNTATAHDYRSTIFGVIIMLGAIALGVYAGPTVWSHYITGPNTEGKAKAKVQVEIDQVIALARFYDEKKLSEIPMAPIVSESAELGLTLPATLLSDSARSQIVSDVHKQMKVTEAGSRFKDWKASVERIRYYFEDKKLVSYYVRASLTAPDPADATKRIDKGFGSCTFKVSEPTYEKTLEFLRATRQSVTRKLQEAGFTDLSGKKKDTAPVATTSPTDTGDTVTSIPGTEGLSYEEPEDD